MNQANKLVEALELIANSNTNLPNYKNVLKVQLMCIKSVAASVLQEHAANKEGAVEYIAQWVISNRYPKSEFDKVSDHDLYYGLIDRIKALPTPPKTNNL